MKQCISPAILTLVLFFTIITPGMCDDKPGTGLEVDNYKELSVMIEPLNDEARKIGLSMEAIKNKVDLKLRSAGIIPTAYFLQDPPHASSPFLHVNLHVIEEGLTIEVGLLRRVYYFSSGQLYFKLSNTWEKLYTGTHSGGSGFILDGIEQALDTFLNEYLKVNMKP